MRTRIVLLVVSLLVSVPGLTHAQFPVSDSDFIWIEPAVSYVPTGASESHFHVAVMMDNSTPLENIVIPLSFAGLSGLNIDTSFFVPPDIVGVTYGPAGRDAAWTIRTSLVNNASKTIMVGFISFAVPIAPTQDTLCYIHFALDANAPDTTVALDTTFVPPFNHIAIVYTDPNWNVIELTPTWGSGTFEIGGSIFPGDVYADLQISTTDIVFLVTYVLRGGAAPDPMWLGDVNGDCVINVTDIIYLVDYIFRGGPAPVAGCA